MMPVKVLVFLLCLVNVLHSQAPVDLTMERGQSGAAVVLATISRITESNVFSDDNRLLRRVAFVESRDGLDPSTFREGYCGGIWQVDEAVFLMTQNVTANPQLSAEGGLFERLLGSSLRIDWAAVRWDNLKAPLFSGLAARIFFEISASSIPSIGNVREQGVFWKSSGFNTNDNDTVELFVTEVTLLELEECPNRGIDFAFLLDSSGSVGTKNFELEKRLVNDTVSRFSVGPDSTQVAVVSYSGFAVVNFHFNNFTTREEVQTAVDQVPFFDVAVFTAPNVRTSTNTAAGLNALRTAVFTPQNGARPPQLAIPRVAVVLSDGQSNVNASRTVPEAMELRNSGVIVYSIGVGNRVRLSELKAIASSLDHVVLLEDFDVTEFDGLRTRITAETCIASVPVDINTPLTIRLSRQQVSFFQFEVPQEGISLSLRGIQGNMALYASYNTKTPNSALHDYSILNNGEIFISPQDAADEDSKRRKRQTGAASDVNVTLYTSVEGMGLDNDFVLWSSEGDITARRLRWISAASILQHSTLLITVLTILQLCF